MDTIQQEDLVGPKPPGAGQTVMTKLNKVKLTREDGEAQHTAK